jgi:RND family efflux transporter MFP subunit
MESEPQRQTKSPWLPIVTVVLLLAAGAVAAWGITTRARALEVVTRETRELEMPTVRIVRPTLGAPQQELVLPGTMQAFSEASIYARTNGYLKRWLVDIGAHVHDGDLLAEIEAPELDEQVRQARADLTMAEANAKLAQSTAERYRGLIESESVSRQDLDNANGTLEARTASVASASSNLKRLEQLQAFTRIEAPFDGVVTARNVDLGQLIETGNGAKELFHVVSTRRLRVFINMPEVYSRAARDGVQADLVLKEFPGRRFKGAIARNAKAIDVASRTLLVEIDVENAKGELLPGSYAEVHLQLPTPTETFRLPVNAVTFRTDGMQVAKMTDDRHVELTPVTVGRDYGSELEILTGLTKEERVVLDPPDSLITGATVRVAADEATPAATGTRSP